MARKMRFTVTLSPALTEAATIAWTTVPGTAVAPSDFTASSGTLTFAAGETSKMIDVPVRSADQETEEQFTVVLSGPSGSNTIIDGTGIGILPGVVSLPVASANNITV